MNGLQAASIGKAVCHICGQLGSPATEHACRRCGTVLHYRKPNSIQRSWALLIAAYVLYLPANLLPIMETRSVFGMQNDTIMSGVVYLWSSDSWVLAMVVFIASVAVPLLKMLSLTLLLVGVQRRSHGQPLQRTKLYRFLELIGRWSMLDVYVVTILVALVQVQSLALIRPGAGVIAFAAVVVLSMLATHAFEPRLIWDKTDNPADNPTDNPVDNPVKSSAGPSQGRLGSLGGRLGRCFRAGGTTNNKEITPWPKTFPTPSW